MLRSIKDLQRYRIHATDGDIGTAYEFYFDDDRWMIRYLVVDTGTWFTGQQVLISPTAIAHADWPQQTLALNLTKAQIQGAPRVDEYKPFSRQQELNYVKYYGWPTYWSAAIPTTTPRLGTPRAIDSPDEPKDVPHLRRSREVLGYEIHATDGDIGKAEDFIIDDGAWDIRYLIVRTPGWFSRKHVLIAPQWIAEVSASEGKVQVFLTCDEVKNSPEFDPAEPVNREYETRLYDYYGRPKYWE
ncbi:MAG: PRC-barrel domain-containing protein [Candidatus Binatia bacterium]